ncbi:MAG TPA: hypothetical protein VHO93_17020 [Actinomycetota bacterium]|nr:hypothetical protein [Actinomycetota bacterium]
MADEHVWSDEAATWDRVGQLLGDMGTVTQNIWRRNLALWSDVSDHLRADTYTADVMATDAARALAVAFDNATDIWSALVRSPERERPVSGLATAFLYFERRDRGSTTHIPPDPVVLRVPFVDVDDLPVQAEIGLHGPSQDGALALRACLAARLQPPRTYLLEPHDVKELVPGIYDGAVYLTAPPRPLANLQVIVG